jgi:methionine-rich copper-binding protein CopC
MRPSPTRLATVTALACLLLLPGTVLAHAELDTPTPADGATVEGTPETVEGTFTQDVRSDGSSLQLRDAAGTLIGEGGVDASDPRRMTIDAVPELAAGAYEVRWTTFSAEDGEGPIRGTWTFTVTAPPTPAPEPEPTPTPAATDAPTSEPTVAPTALPTVAPTPSPSDEGDPAASESDVILPVIVALAIVAGAGIVLLNRRGRASGA